MNPLDMRGPEFLAFYLGYAIVAFFTAVMVKWLLSRGGSAPGEAPGEGWYPKEGDACRLALLRGGREELIRTVLARLAAGGLISIGSDKISRMPQADQGDDRLDDLERRALKAVSGSHSTYLIFSTLLAILGDDIDRIEESLRRDGLLRRESELRPFNLLRSIAVVLICGMGLAKLVVALSRGRTNVGFLLLLIVLYGLITLVLLRPPHLTQAGAELLRWLRTSHEGLRTLVNGGRRASAGEIGLTAAIYGLGALAAVPALGSLRSASSREPSRGWSSAGCGGSSCGGGGGCGGGGCGGGGCGGCGG